MLKFFLLALLSVSAFAIPEKSLLTEWKSTAFAYYSSTPLDTFINAQGMKLYYRSFTNPENKKALVIVPGRTEPAVKYAELIYDLRFAGYDFHILDHQGQGESERALRDPQKGHVWNFDDYSRDLGQWIEEFVLPQATGKELHLLAHSMGAAVSVHFMKLRPSLFRKAVLSAPMFEVNTRPYSETVATLLSKVLTGLGRGQQYAPGKGPYSPNTDVNDVTSSETRYAVTQLIFSEWSELAIGGPTTRWVKESLRATKNIDEIAKEIRTPILLLQAGKDKIVRPGRQEKFCSKSPSCQLIRYTEAGHEILMERDNIRDAALAEVVSFLK